MKYKLPLMPIADRTEEDRIYAYENQESIDDLKGSINTSDLNRIEINSEWLKERFEEEYYFVTFSKREAPWKVNEIVYSDDYDRIRQNVLNLIDAFIEYSKANEIILGQEFSTISEVNALEDSLQVLSVYLNDMIGLYRRSGTFRSGQETIRAPEYTGGQTWNERDNLNLTWNEMDEQNLTAFLIDYRGYTNE